MKIFRLAFTRRWLGYLALAVIFSLACIGLSQWQIDRTNEARTANQLVQRNFNSAPVSLESVLPDRTSFSAHDEWKQVSVTGSYLLADELLARNRPLNGNPGFEVLTPLLLDNGLVFVVDRGYVPTGNKQDKPDSIPEPASGRVTVVVRLQASEPILDGRSAGTGEVPTINLPTVADLVGKPTYTHAYGLMVSESPSTPTRPIAQPQPTLDEGLHISYAIQWILFGIMAFFGLGYAIRTEYRVRNADDPEEKARAEERAARKLAKPRSDSEIEDELIESSRR